MPTMVNARRARVVPFVEDHVSGDVNRVLEVG